MLDIALGAFVIGAMVGAVLAIRHLGRKPVPVWGALLPGVFVVTGLALLITLFFQGYAEFYLILALLLFSLAALDGFTLLFAYHLRGEPLPVVLIVIHIVLALAALVGTGLWGSVLAHA